MNDLYIRIDAGPVVVPAVFVLWIVLLVRLRRHGALSVPRGLVAAAVCIYAGGVVGNTLFPIFITGSSSTLPWWAGINLTPLVNTDVTDMLRNVVVFVPIGILMPLIVRVRSGWQVLFYGFLFSLGIESIQFVQGLYLGGGHVADVNDLLANALGTPIGYALYRTAYRAPFLRRLAGDATWPSDRRRSARAS